MTVIIYTYIQRSLRFRENMSTNFWFFDSFFFSSKFSFSRFFFPFFFFSVFSITFHGHHVGDSKVSLSQKRQEIQKNQLARFFVFRYSKQFSAHKTLNISIYKYKYIIRAILQPPCWRYGGGSFMQKDRKSQNRVYMLFYFAIY